MTLWTRGCFWPSNPCENDFRVYGDLELQKTSVTTIRSKQHWNKASYFLWKLNSMHWQVRILHGNLPSLPSMSGWCSAVHIKCWYAQILKEERNWGFAFWTGYLLNSLNCWAKVQNIYFKYLCINMGPAPTPLFSTETERWNCTKGSTTKIVDQISLQLKCDVGRDKTELI